MMNDKAAAVVSEEQVELAAIALANVHRGHPNPNAYWAWMHEDEQAKFRERATAALQAALGVGVWRPIADAPRRGEHILIDSEDGVRVAYFALVTDNIRHSETLKFICPWSLDDVVGDKWQPIPQSEAV